MNTIFRKNTKCLITVILLTILVVNSFSTIFPMTSNKVDSNSDIETDPLNTIERSDTYQVGDEYELDEWWNTSFRYRIGIEIEELDGIDRYEPVELFLEFEEDTYYEGTERVVAYYGPGNWSDPIPVQIWNDYKYNSDFIKNCSALFIASVSANSNQTYFFYYNENDDNIETGDIYDTGFETDFTGETTLTINVAGDSGSDYSLVLQEGFGAKVLKKDGIDINYHQAESLAPEKQLSHPNLVFLAHMDENTGNMVYDSTGNVHLGGYINGGTWTSGIVRYGLLFDGSNDYVDFGAELESPGDPFHGSTREFTMTAWIKPDDLSDSSSTNHGTQNCFMAKASDSYNDNFEIGVNTNGKIHVYLDMDGRDSQINFDLTGTVEVDKWNFVALKVDLTKPNNKVGVKVNDAPFQYTTNWDSGNDMDEVYGSTFSIGSSEHYNNYFDGAIDEVAFYNIPLSDADIEEFKYLSEPSTIDQITQLVKGDIFSRYQIDWTETFDMHVSDICTFYWDYNLWSIERSIYFDGQYYANESAMIPLNSHYNYTLIDDHDLCRYIYDSNIEIDITDPDFTAEDYTVVYNYPDVSKDAIGIFVENFTLSNPSQMTMTYFNGTAKYYDNTIDFTPGVNNDLDNSGGTAVNTLIVEFWEFVDSVPYVNDNELVWYFNNVSSSLKNPVNIYIYEEDARFYNIEVYVEDSDGRPVPEATITIWNNSASATEDQWNQDTGTNGWTTFKRFSNGTYVVNASYVRYGQTLTITTAQTIINLGDVVDDKGVYTINFLNVDLTSIVLNCSRYYQDDYKGPLSGARLNFTFDDGTGPVVLYGYETTNTTGAAVFRWKDTTSGNVTFSIEWFGIPQTDISSPLDKLGPGPLFDPTKICLDFTNYAWHEVNVTQGSDFKTYLHVYDAGVQSKTVGETISLWVYFYFTENDTNPTGMTGPTTQIKMDLKDGIQIINQNPLIFSPGAGAGNYSITFDTSQPIETGGESWLSGISYTVLITASKPGFDTAYNSSVIELLDIPTRLSANESESYANWQEQLIFDVHLEYEDSGVWYDLDNALVSYYVFQHEEIFGTLTWYGSGGLYRLEMESTDFPKTGEYDLVISAILQNYEPKTISQHVVILEIRTFLNDSISIAQSESVYFGVEKIFYFNYTEAITGLGLSGAETAYFDWEKQDDSNNRLAGGYDVPLVNVIEGIYALDFDTETLDIATYFFDITIKKNNYEERGATLYLYITNRDFATTAKSKYSIVSGNSLTITINITDFKTGVLLDVDTAYVTFRGQIFNFTGSGGIYTARITNIPDAFIMPETILGTITIMRENYTTLEIQITVEVLMVEIFPGMPLFYFLMIVVAVIAVAGSLVTYRYIQQRRIPTFVKKAREMKGNIKGRKSISDSLLYPSKEEYIVKNLGDKWEMLGLSLEDILGIESKKRKKISEISEEFEGGGF